MEKQCNLQGTFVVLSKADLKEFAEFIISRTKEESDSSWEERCDGLKPISYFMKKYHVDRSTIWRWEKEGKVKLTRLGRKVYAKESDFKIEKGGKL